MKNYYEDSPILEQITARLVPLENIYPDCVCQVIMTENFLYVLEDNFDDTYDCHFKIPFNRLISVENYIQENNSKDLNGKNDYGISMYFVSTVIAAIGGYILTPLGKHKNLSKPILKIKYTNEDKQICYIYFKDCSSISGMINAFKKYK